MDPICEVWQSAYVIPVIVMEWNRHTALSHTQTYMHNVLEMESALNSFVYIC